MNSLISKIFQKIHEQKLVSKPIKSIESNAHQCSIPYTDVFYKFVFLSTYGGCHIHLKFLEKDFNKWLINQRKGLNKIEIANNFLDIYANSGKYTTSQIIEKCTKNDFSCIFDNTFHLTTIGKDYVLAILISDLNEFKVWFDQYYSSYLTVPYKNITDNIYWLACHYYIKSNPSTIGAISLGDVAEENLSKVNDHIALQSKADRNFLIQPQLILDYELVQIDRKLIQCRVKIDKLNYEETYGYTSSPFPNKLYVISQLKDNIYFKAIPIRESLKELTVEYVWSIHNLTITHKVLYNLIGDKGTCFYDRIVSFITYQLSPDKDVDIKYINFKYPDLLELKVNKENKTISIAEAKAINLVYPSNYPFDSMYLPTAKYN